MQENLPKTRRQAKSIGSTFYFTNKLCPHGHQDKRYTSSGNCHACTELFCFQYNKTEKRKIVKDRFKENNREKCIWWAAQARSKKYNLPFSITIDDIVIPEFCPILGIKLKFGTTADRQNSPSLDRIIPSLGYVPGNIMVISNRANIIKNNATTEELGKIYHFLLDMEKK
jgi:hypothetical protein